jgi:hypothetical protein
MRFSPHIIIFSEDIINDTWKFHMNVTKLNHQKPPLENKTQGRKKSGPDKQTPYTIF